MLEKLIFLNNPPENCPQCGNCVIKNGHSRSQFHHVFTDHWVLLQAWICSNKACRWHSHPSVKSKLGTSLHTDLQHLHCELGADISYRKSERVLEVFSSGGRPINNHQRIYKTVQCVAETMTVSKERSVEMEAQKLIAQVDGGYVHDWENKGKNYEIMVGKIYRPESIKDKGSRVEILDKHCAASAKKDKQAAMKERFLSAAKRQGLSSDTTVTALSDGARNCWSILRGLEKHCLSITYILDWFHIGKKIKVLENCLPAKIKGSLVEIKEALWKGKTQEALSHSTGR